MRARAHQGELDLVLDVLDVEGPAGGLAPCERVHDRVGQPGDQFPDTGGRRALPAFDREEGLGRRDRYLPGLEADHGAVAPDDLVLRERGLGRGTHFGKGRGSGKGL